MKRVVAVLLVVAFGIAAFVPTLECPDCDAVALTTLWFPDCPRCGDSGRISPLNRVSRRGLDPDLAAVVGWPWQRLSTIGVMFVPALGRLLARSGRELPYGDWRCSVVFAVDGDERLPLALLRPVLMPAGPSSIAVVLFDRDGAVLDLVQVSMEEGDLDPTADLMKPGLVSVSAHGPAPKRFRVGKACLAGRYLTIRPQGRRLDVQPVP